MHTRLTLVIFLLCAVPVVGAEAYFIIEGCEANPSGSVADLLYLTDTTSCQTTNVYTGVGAMESGTDLPLSDYNQQETCSASCDYKEFGVYYYHSSDTGTGGTSIIKLATSAGQIWELEWDNAPANNWRLMDSTDTEQCSFDIGSYLSAGEWAYLQVKVENTASGFCNLLLDGTARCSCISDDLSGTLDGIELNGNSGDAWDDLWFIDGAAAPPTYKFWNAAWAQKLGYHPRVYGFRSSAGATDVGDTLNTGTWADADIQAEDNGPEYTSTASGDTHVDGPAASSLDSTGTIEAAMWWYGMKRDSGGGSTTYFYRYGNDTDTVTETGDLGLGTTLSYDAFVSSSATIAPTISEDCSVGMRSSGPRDIHLDWAGCQVLYWPPAPTSPSVTFVNP